MLSGTSEQPLLYLRRYWLHERQVASEVLQRTAASQSVNEALARKWLDDPVKREGFLDWAIEECKRERTPQYTRAWRKDPLEVNP